MLSKARSYSVAENAAIFRGVPSHHITSHHIASHHFDVSLPVLCCGLACLRPDKVSRIEVRDSNDGKVEERLTWIPQLVDSIAPYNVFDLREKFATALSHTPSC